MSTDFKKIFSLLLRYGLALVILGYFFSKNPIDLSLLKNLLTPKVFITLFFLKIAIYGLVSLRWRNILRELKLEIKFLDAIGFGYLAVFFTYFLPGNMSSDIAKGTLATKKLGSPGKVISSIVLDRVAGLISLVMLMFFGVLSLGVIDFEQFRKILNLWPKAYGVCLLIIILLVIAVGILVSYFLFKSHRFLKVKKVLWQFKSIRFWMKILSMSVLSHFLCAVFLAATADVLRVDGIHLLSCIIIFPLSTLAMIVPLTPGSMGVGQVLYQYLFDFYAGFPTKAALIFTVSQLIDMIFVVLGGIYFSFILKKKTL